MGPIDGLLFAFFFSSSAAEGHLHQARAILIWFCVVLFSGTAPLDCCFRFLSRSAHIFSDWTFTGTRDLHRLIFPFFRGVPLRNVRELKSIFSIAINQMPLAVTALDGDWRNERQISGNGIKSAVLDKCDWFFSLCMRCREGLLEYFAATNSLSLSLYIYNWVCVRNGEEGPAF